MSIEISNVTQIDEGGTNPKTELFEQPLWLLEFDTGEQRTIESRRWRNTSARRMRKQFTTLSVGFPR